MKDLVEVRLTVDTKQLDGRVLKALKPAEGWFTVK